METEIIDRGPCGLELHQRTDGKCAVVYNELNSSGYAWHGAYGPLDYVANWTDRETAQKQLDELKD